MPFGPFESAPQIDEIAKIWARKGLGGEADQGAVVLEVAGFGAFPELVDEVVETPVR
jgi:hypothetical protein